MEKFSWHIVIILLVAGGLALSGCPKRPDLAVSATSHHFGIDPNPDDPNNPQYEAEWQFQVWNSGCPGTELVFDVSANEPWVELDVPDHNSTGPDDAVTITVRIDRYYSETAKTVPEWASALVTVSSSVATELVELTTAPEYFTQSFSSGTDLDGLAVTLTPNNGLSFYERTVEEVSGFPTDPTGGLVLDFSFLGDPIEAGLFGGETVPFYGNDYDTLYISSEGWVSFGEVGNAPDTLGDHFTAPQLSALNVDAADPNAMVSYLQDEQKLIITYENAPTAGAPGFGNDFQLELFFDGRIRISYPDVDPAMSGVIGLSNVLGMDGLPPDDFLQSDLSEANTAPMKAAL